jgi:histone H3/H4
MARTIAAKMISVRKGQGLLIFTLAVTTIARITKRRYVQNVRIPSQGSSFVGIILFPSLSFAPVLRFVRNILQQVARLAIQRLANCLKRIEVDSLCLLVVD